MSEFWSIVVFVSAFIETAFFLVCVFSPSKKELEETEDLDFDDDLCEGCFFMGCFAYCFLFLLILTYVAISIITILAIIKNIGYPIFSYLNCLIVLAILVCFIKNNLNKDKEIETKPKPNLLLKLLIFIQVIYLWYIFIVSSMVK